MVLKPLEFSDCISDSPWFRQNLHEHEIVLEEAYKNIKNIELQCREVITCNRKLASAQRDFAQALKDFRIETVGTNQTDDERHIATCLGKFGEIIQTVEDERIRILGQAEHAYLEPLRKFRQEVIGRTLHVEKKKYEKESTKFYASLEKHLHLSTQRKTDDEFREADAQLDMQQHNFCQASLQYVEEIQSVQERMKFEFVETLTNFLYSWLSFYHVGHRTHEDFKPFLDGIQLKIQKARESFKATQSEAEELRKKILKTHTKISQGGSSENGEGSAVESSTRSSIKQGYLYIQERSKIPIIQDMRSAVGQSVSYKLINCIRRSGDSIDKRFCFDLTVDKRSDLLTLQALSEEDRRQWIDAMDGKQPIYSPGKGLSGSALQTELDEVGFEFVRHCLAFIDDKGVREQGLYRNCGVNSKVKKMMSIGLEKKRMIGEKEKSSDRWNWAEDKEYETKTVSSALKTYLRNLPEPLMTFELHAHFIAAAKLDDHVVRVEHIHYYVHRLPNEHKRMLEMVIRHLRRVADRCEENLMTVGNLGVCFGPTLLRPREETMAAIMDIKFCNVVVEVLIAHCEKIFDSPPPASIGPPKPEHGPVVETSSGGSNEELPVEESERRIKRTAHVEGERRPIANHPSSTRDRKKTLADATPSGSPQVEVVGEGGSGGRESCESLDSINSEGGSESPRPVDAPLIRAKATTNYAASYSSNPNPSSDPIFYRSCLNAAPSTVSTVAVGGLKTSSSYDRISPIYAFVNPVNTSTPCVRVRTLYSCTPDHESELSFQAGQIITNVHESKEEGWLVGTLNGKTGLIPANYVEHL